MRKSPTTTQRGRAKLALVLLGVVSCVGGSAFALAQVGSSPTTPATQGAAAAKSPRSLSIRVSPTTRSVAPYDVTTFGIRIRHGNRRKVKLRALDGVPGVTVAFRPRSSRKSKVKLTIQTAGAPSGTHRMRLLARSGPRRALAAVKLVIGSSQQSANFKISGDLPSPLEPGLAVPLDLALTNPGPAGITIGSLGVSVAGVSAPRATATFPCTLDDFSVIQFSGAYGFTVPASSTRSLSELGFPQAQLPQVEMLDRPVNQNGCKGASLQLDYTGTSTGGA